MPPFASPVAVAGAASLNLLQHCVWEAEPGTFPPGSSAGWDRCPPEVRWLGPCTLEGLRTHIGGGGSVTSAQRSPG